MKQEKIRIGVLSTASIGQRFIIPSVLSLPENFELIGIASRSLETARETAEKFNCKSFGSYNEILYKKYIDAIYIPLPNSLHYDWVKLALERGIHVLVEKSLACTLSEVIELNRIAQSNNLALVENFQFRFHSQLHFIQEMLNLGKIGTLRYIRSSFEFPPFPNNNNIRYQKELGGGALLDAGAYPLKISQLFLGNDISVKASVLRYESTHEVDIGGGAFLKQDYGDVFAEIAFGFNNYYQCSLEIYGSIGKISTNRIFTLPPNINPLVILEMQGKAAERIELKQDNHFINMLSHFYQTIHSQKLRESEYFENINQARLIKEFKDYIDEK